jgi:bifunctional non-homologous end joining protein LigD
LIKGGEDMKPVSAKADDTSALSGKSMKALSGGAGRVWHSNRTDETSFKSRIAQLAKETEAKARPGRRGRAGSLSPTTSDSNPTKNGKSDRHGKSSRRGSKQSGGARSDSKLTPKFIEPMKALLVDAPPEGDWLYEIKFDGFRAMAYRDRNATRLLSRNNKDFADKFPEVFDAIASLEVEDAVIDGEIVAIDEKGRSSFQLLQAYNLGQKRPPILFYAFDLLQLNGEDVRKLPLSERKAKLEALLEGAPPLIRYSKSLGNEPEPLLEQARELGLEGLIGKRPNSVYEEGQRSGNWIKLKLHHEQEFVIGGYTPPGGSRPYFGALLVGVYKGGKLKFAGKVGTGFNTKLLHSLHTQFKKLAIDECPFADLPEKRTGRYGQGITAAEMRRCHWVKPVLVCQIKFTEWTRDDRLRHPVFLGLREDKSAKEVVRENKT